MLLCDQLKYEAYKATHVNGKEEKREKYIVEKLWLGSLQRIGLSK